jgi:hypothetical protein
MSRDSRLYLEDTREHAREVAEHLQGLDFEALVRTFVHPERVLRVLTDCILFTRRDDQLEKVVLRPHQMRATHRVVERAADPAKCRALVWHTQGEPSMNMSTSGESRRSRGAEADWPRTAWLPTMKTSETPRMSHAARTTCSIARGPCAAGGHGRTRHRNKADERNRVVGGHAPCALLV